MGRITNVRNVAVINPPITTVAKGRCTSAPPEVEIAMGKNPKEATAAVIITGLNLTLVPVKILSLISVIPSFLS